MGLYGHLSIINMINKKAIAVIPARYDSTRLPGKPLADINGMPLIYYVWKAATDSKLLDKVLIATDDKRILDACSEFGAECVTTPNNIPSGSDRIVYAVKALDEFYDYIINVQGDEPLITGELIDRLLQKTIETDADVGTIVKKIEDNEEIFDSSVVKVVMQNNGTALYFSRSPIPNVRDANESNWSSSMEFWKHIGIYCYHNQALLKFGELPQTDLEKAEKLEQLRLLQNGATYVCLKTDIPLYGVDTKEDMEKVRKIIKRDLP